MVSACHNKCIQVPQLPWRWVIATVSCGWETQFVIPTSWANGCRWISDVHGEWMVNSTRRGSPWVSMGCQGTIHLQISLTTPGSNLNHHCCKQCVWLLSGWWYTYPSEKYESQLMSAGITILNIWKIRYVPNHQPVIILIYYHYRHSYRYVRRVLPRHEHWGCLAIEHMIGEIAENMAYTQCFLV